MRSSNLIALVTDTGATVFSRRRSRSDRTAPHAVQCRRRQPENNRRAYYGGYGGYYGGHYRPYYGYGTGIGAAALGAAAIDAAAIGTGAAYNNYYNNAGYGNGYYDEHGRYWNSYYNQDYWNAFQ